LFVGWFKKNHLAAQPFNYLTNSRPIKMRIIKYPPKSGWPQLLARPTTDTSEIRRRVEPILEQVRTEGDVALLRLTEQLDHVRLTDLQVSEAEIQNAVTLLPGELKNAIQVAHDNIFAFHKNQLQPVEYIETMPGVVCWRKSVGIEKVGLYIPGGTAPLFSTVLMLGVPAQIAGCREVVLCTPANRTGGVHPAILYAAQLVGIRKIFKVGGAQAIAAMTYGTVSIPKVYKIFGPGNTYVTVAKQLVSQEGVAIDMPAGPSEVAVYADDSANPDFVAADLLSQAEHGTDSQVILVTESETLIGKVQHSINQQVENLPRRDIAAKTLENSIFFLVQTRDEAIDLLNEYAAEHLILAIENPEAIAEKTINAGSVFLGHYTPEAAGDYASGTNHTLPTNAYSRAYSGVSVDSFVRKITFQRISPEGLQNIGATVETMAAAEGLEAHRLAVRVRLATLESHR